MSFGYIIADILLNTLIIIPHNPSPQPQHNPLDDRMDFSIGLASRYIEVQYLDQDIKNLNLHGVDMEFKVFPLGGKHFFFGLGGQYLVNDYETPVVFKGFSMPFGFEFEYFGLYLSLEFYDLENLYEEDLHGDSMSINAYLKVYEDLSLHFGVTSLSLWEDSQFDPGVDNYEYTGTSYNTYLRYKF